MSYVLIFLMHVNEEANNISQYFNSFLRSNFGYRISEKFIFTTSIRMVIWITVYEFLGSNVYKYLPITAKLLLLTTQLFS